VKLSRKQKLRPWMLLYAALLASVGLAGQQDASLSRHAASVSPVSFDAGIPDVRLNSIVRRSDI